MLRSVIISCCLLLICSFCWADDNVHVLFSPHGGCQEEIIKEISRANSTIDIAMFELTSSSIAKALIKAKNHNVTVRVVLDRAQANQFNSKGRSIMENGIDVRYYKGSGIMHNKFAVIDGKILLTGSFNWSAAAQEKNEENLLIIKDRDLIRKYEQRFEYLLNRSLESVGKRYPVFKHHSRVSFFQ